MYLEQQVDLSGAPALFVGTTALALAGETTMKGWVTEAHCNEKGASANHKECGDKCVKGGQKVAFYDEATKKTMVFDADCQEPMAKMMAQEVTLSGVQMKDGMVHPTKVEPVKK